MKLRRGSLKQVWKQGQKDVETTKYWNSVFLKDKNKRQKQQACWLRWANYMDDDLWRGSLLPDNSEPLEVNEIKSNIQSIIPHILLEPPEINIHAYLEKDAPAAMAFEMVAKYIDTQYGLFDEWFLIAYDGLLYGNGILKFGCWDDPLLDHPAFLAGTTTTMKQERIVRAAHNPLYEFFPDRRAKQWKEQRHVMHLVPRHIDDIYANPSYDRKVVYNLTPTITDDVIYGYSPVDAVNETADHIILVEVHDFDNNMLRIFALGQEKDNPSNWLYNGPQPYGICVFENLEFFPRPFSVWGDSVSQIVEKHQKSLSEIMTYMTRSMQRDGIIKILYDLAKLGDTEMAKLESNRDAFIGVTGGQGALADALHVVDYKTASKDYNFITAMNKLQETIRMSTGVTQQEMGIHESGVETKYEASMLKSASEVKNLLRRRKFAQFAERSLAKLLYIISLEYTPIRICEMAGLDPQIYSPMVAQFLPFDGRKFKIEFGNTAVNSRAERIEKLRIFAQFLAPYQQMINPAVWLQMVTKALDLDYGMEMLVYNMMNMGPQSAGQLGSVPSLTNSGQGVVGARTAQ